MSSVRWAAYSRQIEREYTVSTDSVVACAGKVLFSMRQKWHAGGAISDQDKQHRRRFAATPIIKCVEAIHSLVGIGSRCAEC